MHSRSYRSMGAFLAVLTLLLGAGGSLAQTPQTIVIDGVNDFLPANLVDADGGDTEAGTTPIDLGDLYITNDAVKLYIGEEHDKDGWTTVQLGIAIDVNTPGGGLNDPWGRQIEWSLATNKPDYMFYVNLDNNWQAGYEWDGFDWQLLPTGQGPGVLGWASSTGFKELAILLTTLGVSAGNTINVEMWTTQDGVNKGPLDCMVNDDLQLSTPAGTTWETPIPIPLINMYGYAIQAAVDPDPPVVQETKLTPPDFPAESFFDIVYNEPVDLVTSQNVANYAISGGDGGPHPVVLATRDASALNIVHVEVSPPMTASANLYQVTVTNVQDLAGNPIVNNGITNVACFMLKDALFIGRMSKYLETNSDPPDTFTVEGDLLPLTFTPLCDTGMMADTGGGVYRWQEVFHIAGDCVAGTASQQLQWKFVHDCETFEPLGSNRLHMFDTAGGARDTLDFWWGDEDPTQFTDKAIDVEFFLDMNLFGYLPTDTVSINGSELPLNWNIPSETDLVDDGSGNDAAPGDGIYYTVVRFPTGTRKNVDFKYLLNHLYECVSEGNRNVFLNDAEFDTIGGTNGPITLPKAYFNRCYTTWGAVEVIFQVDFNGTAYENLQPGDVISVNGTTSNSEPITFNWDIPSINPMNDTGAYPDVSGGDKIYSASVVFEDSSSQRTEYKYLRNDEYECLDQPNRVFYIDADSYDAVGNPQILPVDRFALCWIVGVNQLPQKALDLGQNIPNPFNPKTEIHYVVNKPGRGSLRVYNLRGELVRTLFAGQFATGPGIAVWDGRNENGKLAGSGVYFYRLEVNDQVDTKQMLLLK